MEINASIRRSPRACSLTERWRGDGGDTGLMSEEMSGGWTSGRIQLGLREELPSETAREGTRNIFKMLLRNCVLREFSHALCCVKYFGFVSIASPFFPLVQCMRVALKCLVDNNWHLRLNNHSQDHSSHYCRNMNILVTDSKCSFGKILNSELLLVCVCVD